MRMPAYVYALVALIAGLPATALGGEVVTAAIPVAGEVPAGSTVRVDCTAEGVTQSGMGVTTTYTVESISVTVDSGTVPPPPQITGAVATTCGGVQCSRLTGSVNWTTSTSAGTHTATCTAKFIVQRDYVPPSTEYKSGSATVTTNSQPLVVMPPVITSMDGPSEAAVSTTSTFEVKAYDTLNLPLTYTWSATGGTVTPNGSNRAIATWQAPETSGPYDVNVSVSNGPYMTPAKKTVSVFLATYQAGLPVSMTLPKRVCASDTGALFAIGDQQTTSGEIALITARGDARGFAPVPEPAATVAYGKETPTGPGLLWVATKMGNIYKIDASTGRDKGKVALSETLADPAGMAWEPTNGLLWVADHARNQVRLIRPDGTLALVIRKVGGAGAYPIESWLTGPIDVAIDAAGKRALVIVDAANEYAPAGDPAGRFIHAFDLDGHYLDSYVSRGRFPGQLTQAGGITVGGAGKIYASDAYQSTIQVLGSTGGSLGTIGQYGSDVGALWNPRGLVLMGNGDLAVANMSMSRIDRFGTGVDLPVCAGDADCDGLPDDWELAHNLNPNFAGDSLLDSDGDGLNNTEELALGTDPNKRDTDGDGYTDRDEVIAGFNPTDPYDHNPVLTVNGPGEAMPPGLVKMQAYAHDPDGTTCEVKWTQPVGPAVELRADTSGTSFIARKPATYGFDAVAVCGTEKSPTQRVTVVVRNVPPLVDAGGVIVSAPSSSIWLDARASSDANGDSPLTFTWDQILGSAISGSQSGGAIRAHPKVEGVFAYQVTVADRAGASASAEVPVVVAAGPVPTAVAAAFSSEDGKEARAGVAVILDASQSLVDQSGAFYWRQVAGAEVAISGADQYTASFVPPSAGRYAFEVLVGSGALRSPPARVDVYVAPADGSLPVVTSTDAPSIAAVDTPVTLDAMATGSELKYSWRQVSGPAAGLTYADAHAATVVPFAAGFHVFEVSVTDGARAESRPVRVAFEARSKGEAIPQARVSASPGEAVVGEPVLLDGSTSTGAKRYRWTQVGGPWVVLEAADAQNASTMFVPKIAGRYAFDLVVDDGKVRSAPARVEIDVLNAEGVK